MNRKVADMPVVEAALKDYVAQQNLVVNQAGDGMENG